MSRVLRESSSSPSVTEIFKGLLTFISKKSASLNGVLLLAPKQQSMASSIVDLPLSPGPTRQLTPGVGNHSNLAKVLKFSIRRYLIRAIQPPPPNSRPTLLSRTYVIMPEPCG